MLKSISRNSGLFDWLVGTARIHWIGESNLPSGAALILTAQPTSDLVSSVLSNRLDSLYSDGKTSILALPEGPNETLAAIRIALESARTDEIPIIPLAIAANPTMSLLGGKQFPLPRAHVVICAEIPFIVPKHPETISENWIKAVQQQIRQAQGRVLDQLSTIKRAPSTR